MSTTIETTRLEVNQHRHQYENVTAFKSWKAVTFLFRRVQYLQQRNHCQQIKLTEPSIAIGHAIALAILYR